MDRVDGAVVCAGLHHWNCHMDTENTRPLSIGSYEVVRRVGRGGTAEVYEGRQSSLNRSVAIKLLSLEFVHDEKVVERFRREKDAIAALTHPNIIHIYEYLEDSGRPCYVMEYLDCPTLHEIIGSQGGVPVEHAVEITLQLLDALGYAHERQIIHRDVKPANVFVDERWRVKLTDFGLVKQLDRPSDLTEAKGPVGTPYYMAPEQVRCEAVGPWTDLYQVSIVFYHMLTGHVPFPGRTPFEVTLSVVNQRLPFDESDTLRVPPMLRAFLISASAKNPAERFQTAAAMADELRKVARGISDSSSGQSFSTPCHREEFASLYTSGVRHGVFVCRKLNLEVPLTKAATYIGSDPRGDVLVPSSLVAPKQAMIRFSGGRYVLIGSNRDIGITVNGEQVFGRECVLGDGDVVRIGGYEFIFIDPR